jgi:hypothetical protein
MRERAEAATPGAWEPSSDPEHGHRVSSAIDGAWVAWTGDPDDERCPEDAAHIASWHPGAALAVADWLDIEAGILEKNLADPARGWAEARAVARAYMGGDSQ